MERRAIGRFIVAMAEHPLLKVPFERSDDLHVYVEQG
jgi:hypothetical protein